MCLASVASRQFYNDVSFSTRFIPLEQSRPQAYGVLSFPVRATGGKMRCRFELFRATSYCCLDYCRLFR